MGIQRWRILAVTAGVLMTLTIACTDDDAPSGASSPSSQTQLDESEQQIEALRAQLASVRRSVIVQAGQTQPVAPDEVLDEWDTEASVKAGVTLMSTYDSSGPAAWSPAESPVVFVTSEGSGYAGFTSETYAAAGLQIIDAMTKEVVAAAGFDLGYESMGTPHGLGVSPDGRWIYVPTSDGSQPWQLKAGGGRLLVVDAMTLRLHQVLAMPKGPHHVRAFVDYAGNPRIIVETQGGHVLLLDPTDDNRVVMAIGPEDVNAAPYQAAADPTGRFLYLDLTLGSRAVASELLGAIGKVDLESGRITYITDVGMYPNGFTFSPDGAFTFVADSEGGRVFKIDNSTDTVVAHSNAAVPGPYNLALRRDGTELWTVGKGEMTFNLGGTLGLVDVKTFRAINQFDIGGQTIDHIILNPVNPDEMWVSSSGTAETIVWNATERRVSTRIPTANGGDTHAGAFVRYEPDFSGELLADVSGGLGSFLDELRIGAANQ